MNVQTMEMFMQQQIANESRIVLFEADLERLLKKQELRLYHNMTCTFSKKRGQGGEKNQAATDISFIRDQYNDNVIYRFDVTNNNKLEMVVAPADQGFFKLVFSRIPEEVSAEEARLTRVEREMETPAARKLRIEREQNELALSMPAPILFWKFEVLRERFIINIYRMLLQRLLGRDIDVCKVVQISHSVGFTITAPTVLYSRTGFSKDKLTILALNQDNFSMFQDAQITSLLFRRYIAAEDKWFELMNPKNCLFSP